MVDTKCTLDQIEFGGFEGSSTQFRGTGLHLFRIRFFYNYNHHGDSICYKVLAAPPSGIGIGIGIGVSTAFLVSIGGRG